MSLEALPTDVLALIVGRDLSPRDYCAMRLTSRRLAALLGGEQFRKILQPFLALNIRNPRGSFTLLELLSGTFTYEQVEALVARGARADVTEDRYGNGAISLVGWHPRVITLLCRHGADPLQRLHGGSPHLSELISKLIDIGDLYTEKNLDFKWTAECSEAMDALCAACVPLSRGRRTAAQAIESLAETVIQLLYTHPARTRDLSWFLEPLYHLLSGLHQRLSAADLTALADAVLSKMYFHGDWHAPGYMLLLQCRPSRATVKSARELALKHIAHHKKKTAEVCFQCHVVSPPFKQDWTERQAPHLVEGASLLRQYETTKVPPERYSDAFMPWVGPANTEPLRACIRLAPPPPATPSFKLLYPLPKAPYRERPLVIPGVTSPPTPKAAPAPPAAEAEAKRPEKPPQDDKEGCRVS